MRFVSDIQPVTVNKETRQVKGLSAVYAVKPVVLGEPVAPSIMAHQEAVRPVEHQHQREAPVEDRRRLCRRVTHLPVLVELRSGVDRRRHNLRGQDIVEHIDEKA